MAKTEHLDLLQQGVEVWNQWRRENSKVQPELYGVDLRSADLNGVDLSKAYLYMADLRGANLSTANLSTAYLRGVLLRGANLSHTNLRSADLNGANLHGANLSDTNLHGATLSDTNLSETNLRGVNGLHEVDLHHGNLRGADLSEVNLHRATLSDANLSEVNLHRATLSDANLRGADLRGADLSNADLYGATLSNADLSGANLSNADLSDANLIRVTVLRTHFEQAVFTGACLEDWNTNSATNFWGAVCDYVYLEELKLERRPREGSFQSGEFAALFQQASETVDLIFKDGIDWQAFFQSFQDLRSQYADQDLSIQAIEKKRGGSFVIRLEVAEDADKKAIESSAKELYETKLTLLEQRYRAELQAKDGEIVAYREQSANLMKITEMLAARPPMSETPKYDMRGAQFAGGFAETVQGDQIQTAEINNSQTFNGPVGNAAGTNYGNMSAIQNNYSSNAEDITRLLTALRDQVQTFPTDQKDEANDVLDDLERDLADEQPDQGRISRRLKKLVALGAAIGTIASGAAAVSGDVSTFTDNVIELTEQLGIPIDQVQPEQLPPSK